MILSYQACSREAAIQFELSRARAQGGGCHFNRQRNLSQLQPWQRSRIECIGDAGFYPGVIYELKVGDLFNEGTGALN